MLRGKQTPGPICRDASREAAEMGLSFLEEDGPLGFADPQPGLVELSQRRGEAGDRVCCAGNEVRKRLCLLRSPQGGRWNQRDALAAHHLWGGCFRSVLWPIPAGGPICRSRLTQSKMSPNWEFSRV